ncbi:hypothetical protein G7Y89_g14984 [Cudoniella acicularis]|uniref:Uncharacterized protein n=1 Tax=Cudoniella acicularis TaxID=354080 RepID=A0A8H4QV91_9HELO|nr:hypothetical protein G7Y89_g14984 [Cudoniella acicularis]
MLILQNAASRAILGTRNASMRVLQHSKSAKKPPLTFHATRLLGRGEHANTFSRALILEEKPGQAQEQQDAGPAFRNAPTLTFRKVKSGGIQQPDSPFFTKIDEPTHEPSSEEIPGETIYALATAPGRAGIAIVRISGPACKEIYQGLCPRGGKLKPRRAHVRKLCDPDEHTRILDFNSIVIPFVSPHSSTGEEVLELHIHGGPATVKAVLEAIPRCKSASKIRYAEAGEFTRRAFYNDRLDMGQVESLGHMLSAETEQQRRAAVCGNSKTLMVRYGDWRTELVAARAEMEALIDFSEDQHFDESPAELLSNITAKVKNILKLIAQHEAASQKGELLKNGIRISLLGPPNAGKSSLLNQLVGREASIVSQEAGTTRDIIEVSLDIRGYLCTFADTAGLRTQPPTSSTDDPVSQIGAVEQEGIRRAKAKASESDIIIALASIEPCSSPSHGFEICYDVETLTLAAEAPQSIIVINKSDRVPAETLTTLIDEFKSWALPATVISDENLPILTISCQDAAEEQNPNSVWKTEDPGNINQLTNSLVRTFENMTSLPVDEQELLGVTARQAQLLLECATHLGDYLAEANPYFEEGNGEGGCDIVLAAEHLRSAAYCLARVTGKGEAGDIEEVLGVVFEKFCVGK